MALTLLNQHQWLLSLIFVIISVFVIYFLLRFMIMLLRHVLMAVITMITSGVITTSISKIVGCNLRIEDIYNALIKSLGG